MDNNKTQGGNTSDNAISDLAAKAPAAQAVDAWTLYVRQCDLDFQSRMRGVVMSWTAEGEWCVPFRPSPAATAEAATTSDAGLIEAGALRQFLHNDNTPGFVAAYDKSIVDREFARLHAQDLEKIISEHRIGLTPENDGGFHAYVFEDHEMFKAKGYGQTPREAIDAAIASITAQGGEKH